MIRYLKHDDIDPQRWDACLDASPYAMLFARSWFLDLVAPGWDGIVQGNYEAVFPVARKRKWGIAYAYQPFFTRYFGVYGKKTGLAADPFVETMPGDVMYMQFALHESNILAKKNLAETRERRFQLLDLSGNQEELRKGYAENTRRNINRAKRRGFEIREGVEPEQIAGIFRSTRGRELKEYKPADYSRLVALMEACQARGEGVSLGVYGEKDRPEAAAFIMGSAPRFIFLKSGVSDVGRSGGAMHALIDKFIRTHAGSDASLDFGGSSIPGVSRFYRGFGAADVVYLQITVNRLKRPFRMFRS